MKISVTLEVLCQIAFQNSHYPTEWQGEDFSTLLPVIMVKGENTDFDKQNTHIGEVYHKYRFAS